MPALTAAIAVAVTASLITLAQPVADHFPHSRTVEEFGGRVDDGIDDTEAFRRTFAALRPGDRLVLAAGTYQHDDVLTLDVAAITVLGPGTTLLATREERSAFHIAASDVVVEEVRFAIASTTRRWFAYEQMKVRVSTSTGVVLRRVSVDGSAAAGIYVGDRARDFRIEQPTVRNTRADGVHVTGGASNGTVDRPTTISTGDDGVAVVSYGADREPCRSVTVTSPTVIGTTWGRGVSVVGGEDVTFTDIHVEDTDSAGVYIGVEPAPYFTRSVRGVLVSGGVVLRANRNPGIDHGAVIAYLGRPELELLDVRIENLDIVDTRSSASSNITIRSEGGPPRFLTFSGLRMTNGPAIDYGGNVDSGLYNATG